MPTNPQKIKAVEIEIGDQLELEGADGRPVWRRVTGWFIDGNGKVNILIDNRYIKRHRSEQLTVVRKEQ